MIGVIADDLTGAAELGAVGLRHGLKAEVVIAGEPGRNADLVCIDTDSRSCGPTEAAQRAAHAALHLQNRGAEWIYKKTDSVLRGNVTPELEALVGQLGLAGALLVPANPALGRTIVKGQYFLRGELIHQTEFARDPKYPRTSSNVLELVSPPARLRLCHCAVGMPLPGSGIVIGEARSSQDLRDWAILRPRDWLMAGGAEFFGALLTPAVPISPSPVPTGKELFVCGSASEATRAFVGAQAERGVPVFALPACVAANGTLGPEELSALVAQVLLAMDANPRAILRVGLPPVKSPQIAEMLAPLLVRVAEAVLRQASVPHVFAEGGATAVALARSMGWNRFAVSSELAPGVVLLSATGADAQWFTMKPGSYAWPQSVVGLRNPS